MEKMRKIKFWIFAVHFLGYTSVIIASPLVGEAAVV